MQIRVATTTHADNEAVVPTMSRMAFVDFARSSR